MLYFDFCEFKRNRYLFSNLLAFIPRFCAFPLSLSHLSWTHPRLVPSKRKWASIIHVWNYGHRLNNDHNHNNQRRSKPRWEREKKKKGRDRLKPTWREPWNFGTIFLQQTHQEYDDSTWLPIKSLLTQQELLRMLYWSLSFNPLTRGKEILFSRLRILLYVAAL